MIEIGRPYIQTNGALTRLSADVSIGGRGTTLYLEAPELYGRYFTLRSDPFVSVMLPTAMTRGLDIHCAGPVSERLLYQLNMYHIPALARRVATHKFMTVRAPAAEGAEKCAGAVGTGFSGGLDSLYTIMTHESAPKNCRITHLLTMNISSREGGGDEAFRGICARGEAFAAEYGYEFIPVNNNFYESLREQYALGGGLYLPGVYTYRVMAAPLALQGLFGMYLASSGTTFWNAEIPAGRVESSAEMEPFVLDCLSTESLRFYSSGAQAGRADKAAAIAGWEPSYRFLHPCGVRTGAEKNCGRCRKCLRLMAMLHSAGALEKYRAVFDVDAFYKNLEENLAAALAPIGDADGEAAIGMISPALPELTPELKRRARQYAASAKAAEACIKARGTTGNGEK